MVDGHIVDSGRRLLHLEINALRRQAIWEDFILFQRPGFR